MRDTIDMAREAGIIDPRDAYSEEHVQAVLEDLKAFEALVRADEREETNRRANASWSLMCEKMVAAEREACAKVCEAMTWYMDDGEECAIAIRARGNT